MMRELLFMFDVCMLRECDGDENVGVGVRRRCGGMSTVHQYVGGGLGIVPIAADVLGMSVIKEMV